MSGADSETTPAASLDVRPRQQTTKRGAGFTVTPPYARLSGVTIASMTSGGLVTICTIRLAWQLAQRMVRSPMMNAEPQKPPSYMVLRLEVLTTPPHTKDFLPSMKYNNFFEKNHAN